DNGNVAPVTVNVQDIDRKVFSHGPLDVDDLWIGWLYRLRRVGNYRRDAFLPAPRKLRICAAIAGPSDCGFQFVHAAAPGPVHFVPFQPHPLEIAIRSASITRRLISQPSDTSASVG